MSAWGAVRVALGVITVSLGTILMILSVPTVVTAGLIESSVGRAGVVVQPLGTLAAASGDRAVVVDEVRARLVAPQPPGWVVNALAIGGTSVQDLADALGDVVLVATMSSDGDGFLGVANVDAVNEYLDGTAYSVAVRPEGETTGPWPTVSVPGDRVPDAPQGVSIWDISSAGTRPELPAELLDSGTLVLMRSDAGPTPDAAMRLEYRVAGADRTLEASAVGAASASVGGLGLILLGGWIIVGRRARP